MGTPIYEMDRYYLDNGKFHLKSKFTNSIRYMLIALFVLFSFTYLNHDGTSYAKQNSRTDIRYFAVEDAALYAYVQQYVKDQKETLAITSSIMKHSKYFEIDPKLITAVMQAESMFNKYAISEMGAFGLMQVLPKWHLEKIKRSREVVGSPELFGIESNIYMGTWVLKNCMTQFSDLAKSLRCYNGSVGLKTDYDTKVIGTFKKIKEFVDSPENAVLVTS